jgi:hypothetical protein
MDSQKELKMEHLMVPSLALLMANSLELLWVSM